MNSLEFKKSYSLEQLVKELAGGAKVCGDFCVYTDKYELSGTPDLTCYLESYPEIDDNDEEIYPEFIRENNLELFFYGDQLEDVIRSVFSQMDDVSVGKIISGINYYIKHDTFIDF